MVVEKQIWVNLFLLPPLQKITETTSTQHGTPVDSTLTLPYESGEIFHTGGDSQWRQQAESMWPLWNWPPEGWRPDSSHEAYHDPRSPYHRFKDFDWDAYSQRVGNPHRELQSPGAFNSPRISRTHSDLSEMTTTSVGPSASFVAEQLQRCKTGELSLLASSTVPATDSSSVLSQALAEQAKAKEMLLRAQEMMEKANAGEVEKLTEENARLKESTRKQEELKREGGKGRRR